MFLVRHEFQQMKKDFSENANLISHYVNEEELTTSTEHILIKYVVMAGKEASKLEQKKKPKRAKFILKVCLNIISFLLNKDTLSSSKQIRVMFDKFQERFDYLDSSEIHFK